MFGDIRAGRVTCLPVGEFRQSSWNRQVTIYVCLNKSSYLLLKTKIFFFKVKFCLLLNYNMKMEQIN